MRAITPSRPVKTIVGSDFDRDATYTNWRPQGSGDWLLLYTVSGCGRITVEGKSHALSAGQAVLYSPNAQQDYRTDEDAGRWRLLWAHFMPRPNWRAWIRWPELARGVGQLFLAQEALRKNFEAAMDRMVTSLREPQRRTTEFALNALEEALLWARQASEDHPWAKVDERVRKAMDYLAANFASPFRLDELAQHSGLSASRLSHLFTNQVGETPQRYSEELRLRQAQQLLAHSSLRVNEVSLEVGFNDPFYFTKRFRRFTGLSPSEYRSRDRHA